MLYQSFKNYVSQISIIKEIKHASACYVEMFKNTREVWRSTPLRVVLLHTSLVFLQIPACFYNST